MINRKPEGYKDLLAYKKAAEAQELTLQLTNLFPKTKNMMNLKDQMDRSGRSGTKNIIEGWKRNSTKEYFNFLGFSIGAIEELKDDAADIAKGLYQPLMGIKGLMGGRGTMGAMGQGIQNQSPSTTSSPLTSFPPLKPISNPIPPFQPFTPIQLESLRFYPLDPTLPPIVQLYLKCKEILMLLNKLQRSLDLKMDQELTKPSSDRSRQRILEFKSETHTVEKQITKLGLVRLASGQYISKSEFDSRTAAGEKLELFK